MGDFIKTTHLFLSDDEKRFYQRKLTKQGNYTLQKVASLAGVKNMAEFHNAGYRGLYNGETADLTVEEIKEEWNHVKNEEIHKIEIKILAIDENTVIANWYLEQNNDVYDGIYQIMFNNKNECIYFKSWEMLKKEDESNE